MVPLAGIRPESGRNQAGIDGEVGVDHRRVQILQAARQLRGIDLLEFQPPRVVDHIEDRRKQADPVLQPDQLPACNSRSARPPLDGSFGMPTSAPSFRSWTALTRREYRPIGVTIVSPTGTIL